MTRERLRNLATATIAVACYALAGCCSPRPVAGTAVNRASSSEARAENTAQGAQDATLDAAKADADAAAARKRAEYAEAEAKANPSPAAIEDATAARVAVARAEERAVAAKMVAEAHRRLAAEASADADAKIKAADAERAVQAKAEADARWLWLCRIIGLVGVAGGGLFGGLLWWLATPRIALPVAGILAGTGLVVAGFGATITWLPLLFGGAVAVAVAAWAIAHQRTLRVGMELSRTVDALEGKALGTLTEAKEELGKALDRSGLRRRFDTVRGTWKRAEGSSNTAEQGGA